MYFSICIPSFSKRFKRGNILKVSSKKLPPSFRAGETPVTSFGKWLQNHFQLSDSMRYIRGLKLLLQAVDFAAHGEVRRSLLKDSPQEAPGVQVHLELLTAVTMCYRIWYWETLESSLLFASCVTLAKTLNHFRSWQSTSPTDHLRQLQKKTYKIYTNTSYHYCQPGTLNMLQWK